MKSIGLLLVFCSLSAGFLFSADSKPAQNASPAGEAVRRVAVTFDDLPAVPGNRRIGEINRKLLETLKRHRIPAVGFVNESRLEAGGETHARIDLLRAWLDAGMELGNHTYSHIQIDRASLDEYKNDVIRGEAVTRRLMREKGMTLRYFRHPQLRTGPTPEYERELNAFLAARGYTVAPVTIDNQEWVYAAAYAAALARADRANIERIVSDYLRYMEECFAFFERLSNECLGYEIKQTLLLHANELNADHFESLVGMMKRRGYRFITLEEALEDAAYKLPTVSSARGDSWLHRWMAAKGLKKRPEPREPEWLNRLIESYGGR